MMISIKTHKLIALVLSVGAINAACVGQPQVDSAFGESVAKLKDQQIYDRNLVENPIKVAPTGQDGLTAVGKYEAAYRESQTSKNAKQTLKSSVFKD